MKRTWTIIGVRDVFRSFRWYESLFGQPETPPGHDHFAQLMDADGTVSDCTVTQSSGSKLLDSTTCALMSRRARFVAARNSDNEPAEARWASRISWTLPSEVQRAMGASAADLDAIRTDVAKIQRTLSDAVGDIPSA